MEYVVKIVNAGGEWWLKATTWTGEKGRASIFASEMDAKAALEKARKFMKPAQFKLAVIIPWYQEVEQ